MFGDSQYMHQWAARDSKCAAPRVPAHGIVGFAVYGSGAAHCRDSRTTKTDQQTGHFPIQSTHSRNFGNVVGTARTEPGN